MDFPEYVCSGRLLIDNLHAVAQIDVSWRAEELFFGTRQFCEIEIRCRGVRCERLIEDEERRRYSIKIGHGPSQNDIRPIYFPNDLLRPNSSHSTLKFINLEPIAHSNL